MPGLEKGPEGAFWLERANGIEPSTFSLGS